MSVWAPTPCLSGPLLLVCLGSTTCLSRPLLLVCLGSTTCLSRPLLHVCLGSTTCLSRPLPHDCLGPYTMSVWALLLINLSQSLGPYAPLLRQALNV